jgi:hypothetical protein
MSPYFLDMTWKLEAFLLVVSVKLIYINNAYLFNSKSKYINIFELRVYAGKMLLLVK